MARVNLRSNLSANPQAQQDSALNDYTSQIDPNRITNDPRFINDLRAYYRERGINAALYENDDELVRRFYRDGVWENVNTVSALRSAARSQSASDPQLMRMARIERVRRALPNFYEEGGRGWDAAGDIAGAVLLDPVNLIGGIAGKAAGQVGARGASLAGRTAAQARRAGLMRGVGAAALTEGGISAGQEAVVDASAQVRDINLGLQESYDPGRTALAAGAGAVMGGVVGGAVGLPGAAVGARQGVRDVTNARAAGIEDEAIRGLSNQDYQALNRGELPQGMAAGDAAPEPVPATVSETPEEPEVELTPTEQSSQDIERINRMIERMEEAIDRSRADDVAPSVYEPMERATAQLRLLRQVPERLAREQEEIAELAQSNKRSDRTTAAEREQALERARSDYRAILNRPEDATPEQIADLLNRVNPDAEDATPTPDASAPQETPDAVQQVEEAQPRSEERGTSPEGGQQSEPSSEATGGPVEEPPLVFGSPAAQRAFEESGLSPADITPTGRKGRVVARDIRDALAQREQPIEPEVQAEEAAPSILDRDDDYARAVQDEVDRIISIGMRDGITEEQAIDLARIIGGAEGSVTTPDELADAVAERIARDLADEDSIAAAARPERPKSELTLDFLFKTMKAQRPGVPDNILRRAAELKLKRAQSTPDARGRGERVSQDSYDSATPSDRPQSITKWGRPIQKGSDYTLTDGVKVPRRRDFPREEALAIAKRGVDARGKAIKDWDGTVEYTARKGEEVYGQNGKYKLDRARAAYAAKNGKVYATKKLARKALGLDTEEAPIVAPETVQSGPQTISEAMETFKDDPNAFRDWMIEKTGGGSPAADTPAATPAKHNGKFLAIRNRMNPSILRFARPDQMSEGDVAATLMGRKGSQSPEDWEMRYLAPEDYSTDPEQMAKAYEERGVPAEDIDLGEPIQDSDVTDLAPINAEDLDGVIAGKISALEADALNNLQDARGRRLAKYKEGDEPALNDLIWTLNAFESTTPWHSVANAKIIADSAQVAYSLLAKHAPNGVRVSSPERVKSIEAVENIFSRYPADQIQEAKRFIERLGGDRSIGPEFSQNRFGDNSYAQSSAADRNAPLFQQRQPVEGRVNLDTEGAVSSMKRPPMHVLIHEVAHWSYFNILTPQDKADFWKAMVKYSGKENVDARRAALPDNSAERQKAGLANTNAETLPQELFAEQFVAWYMRRTPDSTLNDEGLWTRISRYIKAIFDRYVSGAKIDDDLEPLFAKILPDDEVSDAFMTPGVPPTTKAGEFLNARMGETQMVRETLEQAISRGSTDGIVMGFRDLQKHLLSMLGTKVEGGDRKTLLSVLYKNNTGKDMRASLYSRIQDIDEILTGKRRGDFSKWDEMDEKAQRRHIRKLGDALDIESITPEKAEQLADYYYNGYTNWQPADGGSPSLSKPSNASPNFLFDLIEDRIIMGYRAAEKKGGRPPAMRPRSKHYRSRLDRMREDGTIDTAIPQAYKRSQRRTQRTKKAAERTAEKVTQTPAAKRKQATKPSGKTQPAPNDAPSLEGMSYNEALEVFKAHKGTERGNAAAFEMMRKKQAEPVTGKLPALRPGEAELSGEELALRWKAALDDGDMATVDRLGGELKRRAHNNRIAIKPTISEVNSAVRLEVSHTAGVPSDDGIPAKAPAHVREILSYVTHRDPRTQYTLRKATYRMLNLMGRTARDDLGNTDVTTAMLNAEDVARMAGTDPADAGTANFVDFRSPEFKELRNRLRRMSIGLTKGSTSPMDVMHEVGHMLVASRRIPGVDIETIQQLYRSTDDTMKRRIETAYAGKYASRSASDREQLLAEEWFAESLAEHIAGKVSKTDLNEAFAEAGAPELIGPLNRMIDRMVEYVAYVLNGLMGRSDLKQTFRRISFYGDMLAQPKPPLAEANRRIGVPKEFAADYAHDFLKASPRERREAMVRFAGKGFGYDEADDNVFVFYHGTPSGKSFKDTEVVMHGGGGHYGPGIYVTESADIAHDVYANRPTRDAFMGMVRRAGADIPDDVLAELEADYAKLHLLRTDLSQMRREYAKLVDEYEAALEDADEVTRFLAENDPDADMEREILRNIILEDSAVESDLHRSIMARGKKYGVDFSPEVLPVVIRLQNPADFRVDKTFSMQDNFLASLINKLRETGAMSDEGLKSFQRKLANGRASDGGPLRGPGAYTALATSMNQANPQAAKVEINEALKALGYDGILTTHSNTMTRPDGYSGDSINHTAPILFDSSQVKHVEAQYFDEGDMRLRYRDASIIPRGVTGGVTRALSDETIRSAAEINSATLGSMLENAGVPSELNSALMSIHRGRKLTPREEGALKKAGPVQYLRQNSTRLANAGMNWVADWHKNFYPSLHEKFARKFFPIQDRLRALPDAENGLRRHIRNSTGGIFQKQPESYTRIVNALRRPSGSRQEAALSSLERKAYDAIRQALRNEKNELDAAGLMMGNRGPDYFPQVWRPQKVQKDPEGFKQLLRDYYALESKALGREYPQETAESFAQKLYERLADPDADGTILPSGVGSANADHIDFARVIELEKYPELMDQASKYLENDLDYILTKYFENSTRKVEAAKTLGIGGHAMNDYFQVVQDGTRGIAKLLSSKKISRRRITIIDENGPELTEFSRTDNMPFEGRDAQAQEFAKQVAEAHASGGPGAARDLLMSVAVPDSNGRPSISYQRRVEAIIGALNDFKGQPAQNLDRNHYRLAESMAALANRKGIASVSGQGETMQKASIALRSFNNITLLGFTTLSSLGDVVLPLIRSGSFRSWAKGLAKSASDPEYRRLLTNVGVAMENIMQERMIHMYGSPGSRLSNAFFNATMLTPWTDTMRKMAGATGYETLKTMQDRAVRLAGEGSKDSRDYRIAARFMKRYGLGDYLPGGAKENVSLSNQSLLQSDAKLREAVIKFADEAVFQPNPNDIPLWAQTPVGAIVFQLKSFPLMMARLSRDVVKEAWRGNYKPLLYFSTFGPGMGAAAIATKDIVQQRGGDDGESPALRERSLTQIAESMGFDPEIHGDVDTFLGWTVEGLMQMGGVGLLGDMFYSFATQLDNGSYGTVRLMSTVGGPSVGLFASGTNVLAGATDQNEDSNAKERAAVREVAQRVPVLGGVRSLREGAVDAVAGEGSRDSSGRSGGWGSSGWGGSDWNSGGWG